VCSPCRGIRSTVKNNLSLTLDVVREFAHIPSLLTDNEKELVAAEVDEFSSHMKDKITKLERKLFIAAKESATKSQCESMSHNYTGQDSHSYPKDLDCSQCRKTVGVAYEIAVGMLDGTISGVTITQLELIRELEVGYHQC
jgi:hypothetical protein